MMKKITNLKPSNLLLGSALFLMTGSAAFAKQVPYTDAKTVAENFFSRYSGTSAAQLSFTSTDSEGKPLYYVFNMNGNSGFVIVSADDIAKPIIGYSTERGFQKPDPHSSAAFWLSKRETELKTLRQNNASASAAISTKWNNYLTNQTASYRSLNSIVVGPLVETRWNQSPFYNADCPGGSVTGCVATTMAQIMRYWKYPATGTGSSSYCDCTSQGYPNNYGTLQADYGATTYNWNNMPLTVSSANADVAELMSHCGISVEMNYDPAGSSAAVLSSDAPASAQNSYITYFKYDPSTINGAYRASYSDTEWLNMLKADLDLGRPIQYAGFGSEGGHTWVCDGYDDNNLFHMNWGWGGMADGWFDVDGLNPTNIDFNNWQQGLFGIIPLMSNGLDAGVFSISSIPDACSTTQYSPVVKIRNYGTDDLTSCTLNYQLDNGTTQSVPWTGFLVSGQAADITIPGLTMSNGPHVLSCSITHPNNDTDINAANNQTAYNFALYGQGNLPLIEGFEAGTITNTEWAATTGSNGSNWQISSQAASGGVQSVMINNLSNHAGNVSVLTGLKNYDLAVQAHPYIHFKVAYQQKAANNNDSLKLEISNDCGATWHRQWGKRGAALATTSALSSTPFVPAASDFVEYAFALPHNNHTNIFRFVFVADASAPGNNLYLDDINLGDGATVGIAEASAAANAFQVFPNPANGETFLKFSLDKASALEVTVTDISGRAVITVPKASYAAGEQTLSINANSSLAAGVYMVTLSADGLKSSRKLIIN